LPLEDTGALEGAGAPARGAADRDAGGHGAGPMVPTAKEVHACVRRAQPGSSGRSGRSSGQVASSTPPRSEARKSQTAPQTGSSDHEQRDLLHRPHLIGSQQHDELRCGEQGKHGEQELEQPYEHGHATTVRPPDSR